MIADSVQKWWFFFLWSMKRRERVIKRATWILFCKYLKWLRARIDKHNLHSHTDQLDINVFASTHLKLSRMFLLLLQLSRCMYAFKRIFMVLATGGWVRDGVAVYSILQKVITNRFFSRWICTMKNFSNRLWADDIDTMSDSVFRTSHSHTNAFEKRNVNSYLCSSKICN